MTTITNYCSRQWLNPKDSAATGSVVCYDGFTNNERNSFIEIASCHSKARLHLYKDSNPEEFLRKLCKLQKELNFFIEYYKDTLCQ